MFWKVLGIEPTTDRNKITLAYREKLVLTNPEDKPEEFKQLREAYEQALEYANNDGAQVKTPVEIWKDKLEELYNDFSKRKNVECWKELLSDEVCFSLDTKMKTEEVLLEFFMKEFFLSHEVWLLINDRYEMLDRLEELYEAYPKDFIDFVVVDGIKFDDVLPFNMFEPGVNGQDCHTYLDLYRKIRNTEPEAAKELIEQLEQLSETHPYGRALVMTYQIALGQPEKIEDLKSLAQQYNYDQILCYYLSNELYFVKEYKEGEEVCLKGLENDSENARLKYNLAHCLAMQEKYPEAIEQINDLLGRTEGDQRRIEELNEKRHQWNEILIEKYSAIYAENPNDDDNKLNLAWAYIQNEHEEEAVKVAREIDKDNIEPFDYYNLLSNCDFVEKKYQEGIEKLDCLIEVIKNLKDDGTHKTRRRMGRLAEMYSRKGYFYVVSENREEGLKAYKEALTIKPDDADILSQLARIYYFIKDYDNAAYYAKEITRVAPNAYHAYLILSLSLMKLEKDNEAFDAINRALDYNSSDLECYIVKLRLLIRNGAQQPAQDLLNFLDENGAGEDLAVCYCKAMMEAGFNDKQKALDMLQEIIDKIEKEDMYCLVAEEVYYQYLLLIGEKLNANNKEDVAKMMEIADKGLKYDSDHYGLLDYRAWLLGRDGKQEESLQAYLALAERKYHSSDVEAQIGYIYYDDLDKNVEKSLEYFLKAYQRGNKSVLYYIGYCYFFMGDTDNAEKFYLLLRQRDEERGVIDVESYFRMSYIYERRKQYEKALEENDKAIENATKKGIKLVPYYNHKVRLLRLLARYDEAIDVVTYMIKNMDIDYGFSTITEICFQAGNYDLAKKVIDKRLKTKKEDKSEAAKDLILYHRLCNNSLKAKLVFSNYGPVMNQEDLIFTNRGFYYDDMKYDKKVKYELSLLEKEKKANHDLLYPYMHLAEAYLDNNDRVNAKKYAEEALKGFPESRGKYTLQPALYHIALVRIYTCLGEYEKAMEQLELARNSYCGNCKWHRCKDADTFEANLYLAKGDYQKAREMNERNMEDWKDEADTAGFLKLLEKREKNK